MISPSLARHFDQCRPALFGAIEQVNSEFPMITLPAPAYFYVVMVAVDVQINGETTFMLRPDSFLLTPEHSREIHEIPLSCGSIFAQAVALPYPDQPVKEQIRAELEGGGYVIKTDRMDGQAGSQSVYDGRIVVKIPADSAESVELRATTRDDVLMAPEQVVRRAFGE